MKRLNWHMTQGVAQFDETVEDAVIGSFIQLVIKLNETRFTPVFRQLYDWAFGQGQLPS